MLPNLLPYDGEAFVFNNAIAESDAEKLFSMLTDEAAWENDIVKIFGKTHITRRKTAWYGERQLKYIYSGTQRIALPWTQTLLELKKLAEDVTGSEFNSCLLNFYHDGKDGMGWHSDDEAMLGQNTEIASISLGADRRFVFKHKKTKEKVEILLNSGSLLLMRGETQHHWLHALPKMLRVSEPRINLTFRKIVS